MGRQQILEDLYMVAIAAAVAFPYFNVRSAAAFTDYNHLNWTKYMIGHAVRLWKPLTGYGCSSMSRRHTCGQYE